MTQPTQGTPSFDPAHPSVGPAQAWLSVATAKLPDGERLILTLRVHNATLTAVVAKADGERWVKMIQEQLDTMSSLMVVPANGMPNMPSGPMMPIRGPHGG